MYTIYDYLKYYKNTSLCEVKWNSLDSLMCAILVYLPVSSFADVKSINELYDYALNFKKDFPSVMIPMAYEVLELIKDSKRYEKLEISNFINILTNETQFGAVTFRINLDTIISFKGTDNSMIGWLENCRLIYEYPTYTQKKAIDYLDKNINFFDNNVYVVGHSKGGNLAMAGSMESKKFKKIKKIYNFDGPGFRNEEYNSLKYEKLKTKLINILPSSSVVGTILNNDNYIVVASDKLALNQHYPTSWNIFGQYFIEDKFSKSAMEFHEWILGLEKLDKEKLKQVIESFFESFGKEYTSSFKFNLSDIRTFVKNAKNIDDDTANYLITIIENMFSN